MLNEKLYARRKIHLFSNGAELFARDVFLLQLKKGTLRNYLILSGKGNWFYFEVMAEKEVFVVWRIVNRDQIGQVIYNFKDLYSFC